MSEKTKNKLKELRLKHNYTLDDIEKLTGIKRGTYSNYENGNTEPKLKTWQKLANFYGVDVMYLQGLVPNFYEATTKTKDAIISKINTFYFSKNESKKEYHLAKKMKKAVNEYAEHAKLTPLPNELASYTTKQINNYWRHYFSFLFENKVLVAFFNKAIYLNHMGNKLSINTKPVTGNKEQINYIVDAINAQTIKEFQTDLGLFITESVFYSALQNSFRAFQNGLVFCNDVKEVKTKFDDYIASLSKIESNLIQSVRNTNVKEYAEKDRLKSSILHEWFILISKGAKSEKITDTKQMAIFIKKNAQKYNRSVPKEVNEYLEKYSG